VSDFYVASRVPTPGLKCSEHRKTNLRSVSAKTKSDNDGKVLVVLNSSGNCRKGARRDDNSR